MTERTRSERKLAWLLCAPAVLAMLAVTAYPIGYAIVLSVQQVDLRFPDEGGFVGLDNYSAVLSSDLWWTDFFNTVFILVTTVAIELVLGMIIALVMHRAIFGRGVIRTSVLIPYGIITVVAAFAWQFAFAPDTGFVNSLPFIAEDMDWFGGRFSSFAVIIMAEVWKTTPFMALLLLAGLTLVPNDVMNAARVDGAGVWQRFWKVRLPLMKATVLGWGRTLPSSTSPSQRGSNQPLSRRGSANAAWARRWSRTPAASTAPPAGGRRAPRARCRALCTARRVWVSPWRARAAGPGKAKASGAGRPSRDMRPSSGSSAIWSRPRNRAWALSRGERARAISMNSGCSRGFTS